MNARFSTTVDFLFLRDSHVKTTLVATAPIVALWSFLVFSQDMFPQNSMAWDLIHAMAGGWYLHEGLRAHTDFITQLGYLSFLPIHLGMRLAGPSVFAFHATTIMALALVYPLSVIACHNRIANFQAWIFTLAVSAIVLMPTNIGEGTGDISFAMHYNRVGWSIISIFSILVIFATNKKGRYSYFDITSISLCIVVLFYVKITYFVVACAALYFVIFFGPRLRGRRAAMAAVLTALLAAFALLPFNLAYFHDLYVAAFQSDSVVPSASQLFVLARNNFDCLMLVAVALGVWLAAGGQPTLFAWLVPAFLLGGSFALLSQNAQGSLLPLASVLFMFVFEDLRRRWPAISIAMAIDQRRWMLVAALVCVLYPLVFVADGTAAIVRYALIAGSGEPQRVVSRSGSFTGFSVPRDHELLMDAYRNSDPDPDIWWRGKTPRQKFFLSQHEYLQTIDAAVELARKLDLQDRRLLVVDQVNFLPFALTAPPPPGVYLWLLPEFHPIAPETYFAGVDGVFVPRFSTAPEVTESFIKEYGGFIERNYPRRFDSPDWTVFWRS